MQKEKTILIFTDGGCSGNPGPGAWAYLIATTSEPQTIIEEHSGAEPHTTNNRMELQAVIAALESIHNTRPATQEISLHTDSQYVQKGISQWIKSWKQNNWRTANKEPVKNKDLWQHLDQLAADLPIKWNWVKGHAGHKYNEHCDMLVRKAITSIQAQAPQTR